MQLLAAFEGGGRRSCGLPGRSRAVLQAACCSACPNWPPCLQIACCFRFCALRCAPRNLSSRFKCVFARHLSSVQHTWSSHLGRQQAGHVLRFPRVDGINHTAFANAICFSWTDLNVRAEHSTLSQHLLAFVGQGNDMALQAGLSGLNLHMGCWLHTAGRCCRQVRQSECSADRGLCNGCNILIMNIAHMQASFLAPVKIPAHGAESSTPTHPPDCREIIQPTLCSYGSSILGAQEQSAVALMKPRKNLASKT